MNAERPVERSMAAGRPPPGPGEPCVSLDMDAEQTKTALRARFIASAKVELLDNWVTDARTT